MRKRTLLYIAILFVVAAAFACFGACHRVKPQSPSNRRTEADSAQLAIIMLNRQLAVSADKQLISYVKAMADDDTLPYALHEFGFWFRFLSNDDQPRYQPQEHVTVHTLVYTFDGKQLADLVDDVVVCGQNEMRCLNWVLMLMGGNESIEVLAPWYLAYGQQGNDFAEPYQNLRFVITTKPTGNN